MKIYVNILVATALLLITVAAESGPRIIGGTEAWNRQFPFTVAIYVQTENSKFFCGGALLKPQWVISSGTCVYNATLFTVQLGSKSLTLPDENRVTVTAHEYVVHPDFNPSTLEVDIGLIKLDTSVTYTNYIAPISLTLAALDEGKDVVMVGWGQTSDSDDEYSENLRYVEARSLSNEECKLYYGNQITESMTCVEGNYNGGTCTGDTGGPLLRFLVGHYYLYGIASFISGNGCESTDPSGYARTSAYYFWIQNTMGNCNEELLC